MSIGVSPNDAAILLIAGIAAIFVVPLLLAVIALLARFVAWILRIQSGWFLRGVVALLDRWVLVGTSLYLDVGAQELAGRVVEKTEKVEIRREGSGITILRQRWTIPMRVRRGVCRCKWRGRF